MARAFTRREHADITLELAKYFGVEGLSKVVLDLPADFRVPRIAPDELALIDPHLDARRAERLADAARGVRVLRRIRQEDRFANVVHRVFVASDFSRVARAFA